MKSILNRCCFYALFNCYAFFSFSQNLDSLQSLFNSAKHDTSRLRLLVKMSDVCETDQIAGYVEKAIELADKLSSDKKLNLPDILFHKASSMNNYGYYYDMKGDNTKALEYYQASLSLHEKNGNKFGMAQSYNNLGYFFQDLGNVTRAITYYQKSLDLRKEIKDKQGVATCLNNLANAYNEQGNVEEALRMYYESLKLYEELNNYRGMATTLCNIGFNYEEFGEKDKAMELFMKSIPYWEKAKDSEGISYSYGLMASIKNKQGDFDSALVLLEKGMQIDKRMGNKEALAGKYDNLGLTFSLKKDWKKAMKHYEEGLLLHEELKNERAVARGYYNMGNIYMNENKIADAQRMGEKSLRLSQKLEMPEPIGDAAKLLYRSFLKQGKFEKALEMFTLYIQMRDSITNKATQKAAMKVGMQYEFEKKATADSVRLTENARHEKLKHEQEISRQRWFTIGGMIGFVLMLAIALLSFRAYKQKQTANQLITEQKKLVEEKQKEIIASITYAKRIQNSIITSEKYIENNLDRLHKN